MINWDEVVDVAPADPILGVTVRYKADACSHKVNLGVGAYRDENGVPYVLNVVRKAQQMVTEDNKEYLPIDGVASFRSCTAKLVFGNSSALSEKRIATVQSLSGTGAIRLGLEFVKKYMGKDVEVYFPNPTWGNHKGICNAVGLPWKQYRYISLSTDEVMAFDYEGMKDDISHAAPGSIIVFHACAHNPTGFDPTADNWKELRDICVEKKLVPFFDVAYQGYATGDLESDAYGVRLFADADGIQMFAAQSFSKNMGLYGERSGALHVVCHKESTAVAVVSQLKLVIRPMYSNPPRNGSAIVTRILQSPEMNEEWKNEVKQMSERVQRMRSKLYEALKERGLHWPHMMKQIGMFSYTPITTAQAERLEEEHHIFMTRDGRISVAGLTDETIGYVADSICKVL